MRSIYTIKFVYKTSLRKAVSRCITLDTIFEVDALNCLIGCDNYIMIQRLKDEFGGKIIDGR